MRKMSILTACTYALLISKVSVAQEKESELDPVTITTSLSQQKSSQTGRNLIVIKGEKFAELPVHSVDELLRFLPGVEVQMRGPMGAQSDIVLRGGTFQQVLVILDGMRLNDANTGHFSSYIPIAPAEIDRIEILKGASSAVYGSEAVGGVIHIITKSFAARQGAKSANAIAEITGGQYGIFNVNAGGNFSNGNTSVSGGLLSNNTNGQPQRGINGFVHSNTASLSLSQFLNDKWQLAVRSAYDNRRFAAQNFYTNFASDTATEKVKTWWNQLQVIYNGKKDQLSFDVGYKKLQDHYVFNHLSSANDNTSDLLQALVTDEWKVKDKTTITSGAQFINKKIVSNDRGNHSVAQAAAFAILNQQWGEHLFISPAVRLDWNERRGWEFVPQANLSYHAGKFQLRGSAGKTIRDADFTERYNNYNKSFVSSGKIGNPDLMAERSFSYEAGADYFATGNLKISGTFFQRFHKDLIDYVNTPYSQMPRKSNLSPTGSYSLAKNISSVNTTGIETDIEYSRQLSGNQRIWSTFGFTWLNSDISNATTALYVSSHAKFLVNMNIDYSNKWFLLSINGIYKERQPQTASSAVIAKVSKDYFVLNMKAEGFIWQHKLSVFAEADNLFDKNYTDLLGAQMPGRWLMGGLKITLSK